MSENKPQVAAGENLVDYCPRCGVKYIEPIATLIKQKCPDEGGCGQEFSVKVFS